MDRHDHYWFRWKVRELKRSIRTSTCAFVGWLPGACLVWLAPMPTLETTGVALCCATAAIIELHRRRRYVEELRELTQLPEARIRPSDPAR